jgi:hypothetical protein
MFLMSYSKSCSSRNAAGLARLSLIAALTLYLTDFLNRTFPGENTKNHAFSGRKKSKAAAVYQIPVKDGAAPGKLA